MTAPYLIPQNELPEKYISMHTSDRILFRRCRRRWYFESQMYCHLREKDTFNQNLWFGTGYHFALEDYHGYNVLGNPINAFNLYWNSFKKEELPMECHALGELASPMLAHYTNEWLPQRNEYETFIFNGVPQVEVEISIYIPELSEYAGIPVIYQLKIDRVLKDLDGLLWTQDYKTVGKFDTAKLVKDNQVSAYTWAFPFKYNTKAQGMVYTQFKKAVASEPKILKNGDVSSDKSQNTTYKLYLEALKKRYGELTYPKKHQETLEFFANQENPEGDNFIRWDKIAKNENEMEAEYQKILAEGYEMLNPELSLYDNPTKDCSWDCAFITPCIAMDDGGDYKQIINQNYEKRINEEELWRKKALEKKSVSQ